MSKPTEPIAEPKSSFRQLLRMRNFRLLWGAGGLSAIGDQFDLIAFPWLVLLITGDPLAVGAVIAVGGIPTAVFMLLGGSLADRFSPRAVMQVSNIMRIALSAGLAALILTGSAELWLVYVFALLKGTADSLYYPAQLAIVPEIVPEERLRQSNAIIQTTADLGGFVGPMFAGALIAFLGTGDGLAAPSFESLLGQQEVAGADLTGVGLAFAAVGLVIFVSSLLLALMRLERPRRESADRETKEFGIFKSIGEGIRFVRSDAAMFTMFLLVVGIGLMVEGPVFVGIPLLANTKFAEGALALGVVLSAFAGGSLFGAVLAGTLPAPKRLFGPILVALFGLSGLLLMPFGFLTSMWTAAALSVVIGITEGYAGILFLTWLQIRTPQKLMGRVMSLLMISAVGLAPLSHTATGALLKLSLEWVFVGAGAILALLCLAAIFRPEVRSMTMPEAPDPPDAQ